MDQLTMDDLKSHVDNAIGQVSQSVTLCSLTCLTVVQILSCVKVESHLIPPLHHHYEEEFLCCIQIVLFSN